MPTTKKVPAAAFAFSGAACEFAADAQAKDRGPIKLAASSGEVFNHWFWGPVVFDIAGITLSKPRVTLDYCHRAGEVIGYADQIDQSGGKLIIAGELVSAQEGDRAAEVLTKGRAGVPWEASLSFDPYNGLRVEEFQAGIDAQVNGRTIPGPITVIRACLLRGVAVCPYGADPFTASEFSAGSHDLTISIHAPGAHDMAVEPKTSDTPAEKTAAQIRTELIAANQDYVTRFGAELAAKWGPLGESRPLLECYGDFVAQLRTAHAAEIAANNQAHTAAIADLTAKVDAAAAKATEAEKRLASLSLGEEKPVSGTSAEASAELPVDLQASLSPSMAKYVAAQRAAKAAK